MADDKRAHEMADRLAEEFGRDAKKMRVYKHDDGNAQIAGILKRNIGKEEMRERTERALKDMK